MDGTLVDMVLEEENANYSVKVMELILYVVIERLSKLKFEKFEY
jgi:hypothetical protein